MMDNKIHNLKKDGTAFVSETVIARKGPISDGDLYPLNKDDCSTDKTVYFEK